MLSPKMNTRKLFPRLDNRERACHCRPEPVARLLNARIRRALEGAPEGGVLYHAVGGAGKRSPGVQRSGGGDRAIASEPAEDDIAIGGATLAAEAAALGLIDEYRARVYPVLLGGGRTFFPQREHRVNLELIESRTLNSKVVYLRYRVAR